MKMTVDSQGQSHGMLRNCFGGIAGHTHHDHVVLSGDVQIYIIEAGAAQQDQLYAAFMKHIQGLSAKIGAYKGADRFISFGQGSRLGGDICFQIINGDIGKIGKALFKAVLK